MTLASLIDHTKLTFSPGENEEAAVRVLAREAREHGFAAVCVRPRHVVQARRELAGTGVKVATVIGFPEGRLSLEQALTTLGSASARDKVREAAQAVSDGAQELDLVLNVGTYKKEAANPVQTREHLLQIYAAAGGVPIKVIVETGLLTRAEIVAVSRLCAETGMAMVKTSTGMVEGIPGAKVAAVEAIREGLGSDYPRVGIKASGGIKTREQAEALVAAGATRLGTSSGIALVNADAPPVAPGAY